MCDFRTVVSISLFLMQLTADLYHRPYLAKLLTPTLWCIHNLGPIRRTSGFRLIQKSRITLVSNFSVGGGLHFFYYRQNIFNQQDTERLISPIFKMPSLLRAIPICFIENRISDMCYLEVSFWAFTTVVIVLWLIVRRTRLSTVGDRAFPVAVARIWKNLPQHVTSAPSLHVITSRPKIRFICISFPEQFWIYSACEVTSSLLDTLIGNLIYLLTV